MTPTQLTSRWKTPAGKIAVRAITNALRSGTSVGELQGYVANLPGIDEVAPNLDLRGLKLPELGAVRRADLGGTRFDHAEVSWAFGGSSLRGCSFNRAEGRNADFGGCDLTGASAVRANLPGAVFFGAKLVDANLAGIKMRSGQLKAADCTRAIFREADLRLVWAADAHFDGADFSGADLVGASLGRATWNEATRFDGAILSPEGTPAELRAHALAQGATLKSEKGDFELALLRATRAAFVSENDLGEADPIARRLDDLIELIRRDPTTPWSRQLFAGLNEAQRTNVQRALRKAANNIGAYLD
jgi:uncharacterized protein YjbI with pentapeptide repeats